MPETEPTTPETPAVEPIVAPTANAPIQLPDDHPLVKTLAAQKETLKELREKAKRLDDIEEANKTELQKALDRAEAAERAASTAESARLRASVAAKHGVPEALLTGSSEEDLEASAATLLAFKGATPSAPSADGQGKQGQSIAGSKQSQITSVDELKQLSAAEQLEARRDGRLDTLLGISN